MILLSLDRNNRIREEYKIMDIIDQLYNSHVSAATLDALDKYRIHKDQAPLLILVGNAGTKFLDREQVKNYYIEARELCKIYNNPLMLMKIENYLKE